jgi:putative endonuclease
MRDVSTLVDITGIKRAISTAKEGRSRIQHVRTFYCHFDRSGEISYYFATVARDYSFWIYIVTNRNHSVLYIGLINSLSRRSWQHRQDTGALFPAAYRCTKLIYYEHYWDIRAALARDTQLKNWSRAKKVALINRLNPRWMDIGDQLFKEQ